jgi:hypothetical protein
MRESNNIPFYYWYAWYRVNDRDFKEGTIG